MRSLELSQDTIHMIQMLSDAFEIDFLILDLESNALYQTDELEKTLTPPVDESGHSLGLYLLGEASLTRQVSLNQERTLLIGAVKRNPSLGNHTLTGALDCIETIALSNFHAEQTKMLLKSAIEMIETPIVYALDNGIIECHNSSALQFFDMEDTLNGHDIHRFIGRLDLSSEQVKSGLRRFFTYQSDSKVVKGAYYVKETTWCQLIKGFLFMIDEIDSSIKGETEGTAINRQTSLDDIYGQSEKIQQVKDQVARLRHGHSTVLINGESGTGKELFARAIHYSSDHKSGPFIAINCAAIPDSLLESELFGYEEGSFTGARKGGKPGKFELAEGGTIFLDEIGDMKYNLQAKLLRFLQENTIERIGGKEPIPVDVRVISATHEELHEKVENGSFRKDLFYRLSVVPIRVPPLRDRQEDILQIAKLFLARFSKDMGKIILDFDDQVKSSLVHYLWPGNVRELENVVEYAVNMTLSHYIQLEDLPIRFRDATHRAHTLFTEDADVGIRPIATLEKSEIMKALAFYGRDKKGVALAAKALGISVSTLYRRIRHHSL